MMITDPNSFPAAIHEQPWPKFSLVLEQPPNFDRWTKTKPGERWVPFPPGRAAIHLKCIKSDTDRLVKLVAVAKTKSIWLDEFGKCFPSEVVTKEAVEADREAYDSIINGHMAVMHSYGKAYVPGLLKARSYFQVEKLPAADGTIKVHMMCVRDILQDIEFGGKKVFQCVLRSDGNSRYQVYFKARCPATCSFVREFLKCPAAQITCYLTKRGVNKKSASDFAKKCFDHSQLLKVVHAKYNSTLKIAYVKADATDMDIGMAAREDDFIDRFGHLTEQQIADELAKDEQVNFDPALYDFEGGQSVTSIHPGTRGPQRGTGVSIGKSQYSLASAAASKDQLDEDEEDDETSITSQRQVTFAMLNKDGTEMEALALPAREEVERDEPSEDDEEVTSDPEHKDTIQYALWVAAGADPLLVEQMLDQLETEILSSMDGVELDGTVAALITDEMRVRLRLDAQQAEETELRYIEILRSALQKEYGINNDDSDNQFPSSEFGDETGLPTLDSAGALVDTGPPQGSSNQSTSSGKRPTTSSTALSTDESLPSGTAQTGGSPG
jgi:hypothetical protein